MPQVLVAYRYCSFSRKSLSDPSCAERKFLAYNLKGYFRQQNFGILKRIDMWSQPGRSYLEELYIEKPKRSSIFVQRSIVWKHC
jgi:hypothetical protein